MALNFPLRLFFDSDVVIAGSASKTGASFLISQLAEAQLIKGYISIQVKDECIRNIESKLPEALTYFISIVDNCFTETVEVSPGFLSKAKGHAHSKDIPILAAAIQTDSTHLVTFNTKHYYPDKELNIKVVTPGEMLKEIRESLSKL